MTARVPLPPPQLNPLPPPNWLPMPQITPMPQFIPEPQLIPEPQWIPEPQFIYPFFPWYDPPPVPTISIPFGVSPYPLTPLP